MNGPSIPVASLGLSLPVIKPKAAVPSATETSSAANTSLVSQDQLSLLGSGSAAVGQSEELFCGTRLVTENGERISAFSGLTFETSGPQRLVNIPGQGQIKSVQVDGEWTLQSPTGSAVDRVKGEDGQTVGYRYENPDGSRVTVDIRDMSYSVQNKSGTMLQSFDHSGGQFIACESTYRTPDGQHHTFVKELYVDGAGQIVGDNPDKMEFLGNKVRFTNPGGHVVTRDLTVGEALSNPPTSAAAPAAASASSTTVAAVESPQILSEADELKKLLLDGLATFNPQLGGATEIESKPTAKNLGNGAIEFSRGDRSTRMLPNGLVLGTNKTSGEAIALDVMTGQEFPVEKTAVLGTSGQAETRFDVTNSLGQKFSLYSQRPDIIAESPSGDLQQWLSGDGSQRIAFKGPQGLQTVQIAPNGMPTASDGAGLAPSGENKDLLDTFASVQGNQPLPIPLSVAELQQRAQQSAKDQAMERSGLFKKPGDWRMTSASAQFEQAPTATAGMAMPTPGPTPTDLPIPPGMGEPSAGPVEQPGMWGKVKNFFNPQEQPTVDGGYRPTYTPFGPAPGTPPDPNSMASMGMPAGMPLGMPGLPAMSPVPGMGGFPAPGGVTPQGAAMLDMTRKYVQVTQVQTALGAVAAGMNAFMPFNYLPWFY